MRTKIDQDTWLRKDHFKLFDSFEEPYYSIVADVDCSVACQKAKSLGVSFFLYYLHCSLVAVNQTEQFRYRAEQSEVYLYDQVNVSATVMRADKTFGFGYWDYKPALADFVLEAQAEIARIQYTKGLTVLDKGENLIHYSAIPWINFTGLTHARSFSYRDSVPKISFGKVVEKDGIKTMPVSITVHHGLVDGYHIGLYLEKFQTLLNA